MGAEEWDRFAPVRRLSGLASTHRLALVEPLPSFLSADRPNELFFGEVGHLTPRGHRLLAEAIHAALDARRLYPPRE
jgi:phospholipase/lecithinase/hemolysin